MQPQRIELNLLLHIQIGRKSKSVKKMEESEEIKKETKRRNPKRKSAISTEKEKKDADESAGEIKFPKPPRKSD